MKFPKNRWLMALAAVGIQLSIGSIYAYSAWKMPLENTFGWSASKTSMAFSIAIATLGLSAAFLGKLVEKYGPRFGSLVATGFFSLGLLGSGWAVSQENLLLFYLFFGVVSGVGLGFGYISPVSTLVRWFPKQRGLATGLAIMGFGFGGMLCTQLIDTFNPAVDEIMLPTSVTLSEYHIADAEQQSLWSIEANATRETENTRSLLIYDKSNIVKTFIFLAIIYGAIMLPSALYLEAPKEDAASVENSARPISNTTIRTHEVSAANAVRDPLFYGLWLMLFLNATCGIALIATAKKMGYEMVHLSAGLASLMVMGISLFNGLGRIFWSTLSDTIGRPNTFIAFFVIEIIVFPTLAHVVGIPWMFMLLTFIILSCYGGGFSTMPAYITDLFGMRSMPVVLGWILTAWSTAGVVGPMLNAAVYEKTHSYSLSLYLFTGTLIVALAVSIYMKFEINRRKYA